MQLDWSDRMAKVRRSRAKASPPRQAPSFEEQFGNVANNFVHLGAVAREQGDVDLERGLVAIAGLAMGMWLELHRIADALEALRDTGVHSAGHSSD